MKIFNALFFLALLVISSCGEADKNKTFSFNLQNGKTYRFESEIPVTGGRFNGAGLKNIYDMKVDEVKDGITSVTVTQVELAGAPAANDSSAKRRGMGEMMERLTGGLKGRSFTMKFDAMGKVTEVAGLKEILKPMADSLARTGASPIMAQMAVGMGELMLKNLFSRGFDIYPAKIIRVGDSWERQQQEIGVVPRSVNTTFTVKEIRGGKVFLQGSSVNAADSAARASITDYEVDEATGLIYSAVLKDSTGNGVKVLAGKEN